MISQCLFVVAGLAATTIAGEAMANTGSWGGYGGAGWGPWGGGGIGWGGGLSGPWGGGGDGQPQPPQCWEQCFKDAGMGGMPSGPKQICSEVSTPGFLVKIHEKACVLCKSDQTFLNLASQSLPFLQKMCSTIGGIYISQAIIDQAIEATKCIAVPPPLPPPPPPVVIVGPTKTITQVAVAPTIVVPPPPVVVVPPPPAPTITAAPPAPPPPPVVVPHPAPPAPPAPPVCPPACIGAAPDSSWNKNSTVVCPASCPHPPSSMACPPTCIGPGYNPSCPPSCPKPAPTMPRTSNTPGFTQFSTEAPKPTKTGVVPFTGSAKRTEIPWLPVLILEIMAGFAALW